MQFLPAETTVVHDDTRYRVQTHPGCALTAAAPFRENVFEKRCGGCHKVLASRYGGLGRGAAGPISPDCSATSTPQPLGVEWPWNRQRLARWLKNRGTFACMPVQPVSLSDAELRTAGRNAAGVFGR